GAGRVSRNTIEYSEKGPRLTIPTLRWACVPVGGTPKRLDAMSATQFKSGKTTTESRNIGGVGSIPFALASQDEIVPVFSRLTPRARNEGESYGVPIRALGSRRTTMNLVIERSLGRDDIIAIWKGIDGPRRISIAARFLLKREASTDNIKTEGVPEWQVHSFIRVPVRGRCNEKREVTSAPLISQHWHRLITQPTSLMAQKRNSEEMNWYEDAMAHSSKSKTCGPTTTRSQ
ncbi:hypothetical protein C8R45DRAFT_1148006, partial [Mycena sanguinolenta]